MSPFFAPASSGSSVVENAQMFFFSSHYKNVQRTKITDDLVGFKLLFSFALFIKGTKKQLCKMSAASRTQDPRKECKVPQE